MTFDEELARYNDLHPKARIEVRRPPDSADFIVLLSGDLEMKTSNDIGPMLESALLVCDPPARLVLDLSHVGYVSSTGVGLFATTMTTACRRSIAFVLLDIPPRIRNIMDTLGLLSVFTIEESGGRD